MVGSARLGGDRSSFGIALGCGALTIVAATLIAGRWPDPIMRLAVIAFAVGGFAAAADSSWASLATAGLGYLMFNGFLANRDGELTWDGLASVVDLAALAAATGLGLGSRWVRLVRHRQRTDEELRQLIAQPCVDASPTQRRPNEHSQPPTLDMGG